MPVYIFLLLQISFCIEQVFEIFSLVPYNGLPLYRSDVEF